MSEAAAIKQQLETAMKHQLDGRYAEAEAIYNELLDAHPDQPDAMHLLGLVRMEQERDEEALVLMERSLALFPAAPHFHHNLAGLYRRMGRLKDAEARFRQAIELKPDYGEAYQGLAEMIRFEADDPLIRQVAEQLRRSDLDARVLTYFHFAAGKILDDIGEYARAYRHFSEGNRLAARKFDSVQYRSLVKELLYTCSRSWALRLAGSGVDSEIPTFIIGMPRSGTSLIEQILASHSAVFGAGELNDMKYIAASARKLSSFKIDYPGCLPGIRRQDYALMASEYLKRVQKLAGDEPVSRIIDKHPLNFQFVGLIYAMFPNARIIHTVRDPLDTCLSCFFQNFTRGQDYSFDIKSLGLFYNDYRRLMEHWETVYPGRMYTVRYEDMIADQAGQTRGLLKFMGLPFEAACIDFHKTERKVSTASFLQVRKPIYTTSQKRWMNYSAELAGLARVIGVQVETPVRITGSHSILS